LKNLERAFKFATLGARTRDLIFILMSQSSSWAMHMCVHTLTKGGSKTFFVYDINFREQQPRIAEEIWARKRSKQNHRKEEGASRKTARRCLYQFDNVRIYMRDEQ
jgi:hypothetical protein